MSSSYSSTVLMITRYGMGSAEQELQLKLLGTYLKLIEDADTLPAVICCYTDGVRIAVTGSPLLDTLKSLEAKGVQIILCSTCLNYFNLADQVRVGIVGGMPDIIEAQLRAEKVITL